MCKVTVNGIVYETEKGTILKDFFIKNNIQKEHPCGGMGVCKKCLVTVNGKDELSCRYTINSDITVEIDTNASSVANSSQTSIDFKTTGENLCFCFDLGTTGLALALVDICNKKIIDVKRSNNPQKIFGADVISRIAYCTDNGVDKIQSAVIDETKKLISAFGIAEKLNLYISGNTTMLHIFAGVNPEKMGKAPYTPEFLDFKRIEGKDLGFDNINEIILLPSISAFVGADLVSGLNFTEIPPSNKYNLLIDLGTNAEIILYSQDNVYCTSAAAGPCFEGANISQGMTASNGAIYEYFADSSYSVIDDTKPVGICGTGLVDIVATLLNKGIIDESGYMEQKKYEVAPDVFITDGDIRQVQLAKAAVYAGIITLLRVHTVSYNDINTLYISGGFSEKINIRNAVRIGLIPRELEYKARSIGNSSLSGTVKYAIEKNDLLKFTKNAVYTDLATSEDFYSLYIDNMGFQNQNITGGLLW